MAENPAVLLAMFSQFPGQGTVVVRAACLITRPPSSTDSVEARFALTVEGAGAMKSGAEQPAISRMIPPASALSNNGQWLQFHDQFRVGTAKTLFKLSGSIPAGSDGEVALARLMTLTFIPD
jgi:hypothetical protein